MDGEKTFQGVPVAPGKRSNRERIFRPGYTGQQDEYGLDVPSKDLNDYYNASGTYSLMNGGENTLTPHLKSLMKAAWAKYKMDRADAEKNKRMMNNIKQRNPGLVRKLNDNFRRVSNINIRDESTNNGPPVRRNLFGNSNNIPPQSRQRKTLRKSQRREKKTRRQRK
jgi:hypothetical protein